MANKYILLADDIEDQTSSGRSRSHLLRDLAAEFARRLKEPLWVLYANKAKTSDISDNLKNLIETVEKRSEKLVEKELSHYPIEFKINSVSGHPSDCIIKEARDTDSVEMVVVGAHHKKGLKKTILGSVSEEVVRNSLVPVLILGPEALKQKYELPLDEPLRILFLSDLSGASGPAEKVAIDLTKKLKAQLTVCHSVGHQIFHLKEMLSSLSTVPSDSLLKNIRRGAESSLTRKVKQIQNKNIDVERLLIRDERNIEDVIVEMADDSFDLIVMGTHTRNKVLTAFIGSSARNLILRSPIPVMVVRSAPIKMY
ncbi:MAG TPA: universal stress protein [Bdellovibrio sp.]|uniref:universal stress protein n=1 Tax=Bdellovibrio sp. TaxID=28201 RepID=UPI002EF7AA68